MVGPVFQEGIAHAIEAGLPFGRTAATVVVFQVVYVYHINTTDNPAATKSPINVERGQQGKKERPDRDKRGGVLHEANNLASCSS
jgi:hypothetical protein